MNSQQGGGSGPILSAALESEGDHAAFGLDEDLVEVELRLLRGRGDCLGRSPQASRQIVSPQQRGWGGGMGCPQDIPQFVEVPGPGPGLQKLQRLIREPGDFP
jgi:hypothetical protein